MYTFIHKQHLFSPVGCSELRSVLISATTHWQICVFSPWTCICKVKFAGINHPVRQEHRAQRVKKGERPVDFSLEKRNWGCVLCWELVINPNSDMCCTNARVLHGGKCIFSILDGSKREVLSVSILCEPAFRALFIKYVLSVKALMVKEHQKCRTYACTHF